MQGQGFFSLPQSDWFWTHPPVSSADVKCVLARACVELYLHPPTFSWHGT
jgi:hypothetical protein